MEAACSGGEPWERQQRPCEVVPTTPRDTERCCVDHIFQGGASLETSYPQAYAQKIAGCTCISCRTKRSVEHTGDFPEGEIAALEGARCYMNLSAGRRHNVTHNARIGDHNTHNSCCCQAFYHAADVTGGASGGGRLRGMCNSLLSPRQTPQTSVSNCILTPRHPTGRPFVSSSPSTLQAEICAVGTRCSKESIDGKSADQGLSCHGFSSHEAEKKGPQIMNADQRDVGMGSLSKGTSYDVARALLNQVTLYKWYLRRPNGPCSSEVAVGGFLTLKLLDDERVETEPIVERLEKCKLRTKDGVEVKLMGFIDESTSISNGFSFQMVLCFISGFPYTWNHLVVNELLAQSAMGLRCSGLGSCDLHGGEVASHKIFKSDTSQKKSGHEVQALGGEKEVPPSCHFAKDISILEVDVGNGSTAADFTSSATGQENAVLHGEESAAHLQDGTRGEVSHLSKEQASGTDLVCDKTDMDTTPTMTGLDKGADTFPNDSNQEMQEIVQCGKQICYSNKSLEADVCMDNEVQSEVSRLLKDPSLEANLPMSDVGGKGTQLVERPSVDDMVSLNSAVTEEVFDMFLDESNEKTKDVVKHGRQRRHPRKSSGSSTDLQDKQVIAMELPISHGDRVMEVEISPMVLRKRSSKIDHAKKPAKTPLYNIDKKIEKTVHQGRQRCCPSKISDGIQNSVSDVFNEQVDAAEPADRYGCKDTEAEASPMVAGVGLEQMAHVEMSAVPVTVEPNKEMPEVPHYRRSRRQLSKSLDGAQGKVSNVVALVETPVDMLSVEQKKKMQEVTHDRRLRHRSSKSLDGAQGKIIVVNKEIARIKPSEGAGEKTYPVVASTQVASIEKGITISVGDSNMKTLEVSLGRSRAHSSKNMVGTQAEVSDLSKEGIIATKHFVNPESQGKVETSPKVAGKRSAQFGCLESGVDASMDASERKMLKKADHGREGQHSCKSWMLPPPLPQPRVPVSKQLVSAAFGLKTSRSGRLLVPPLAHWRSQTLAHDMDGGIIAILNGSEDSVKIDTGCFNFKPPAEAQAMRLQKKLCAAATENLTKRKLSGGKESQNLK